MSTGAGSPTTRYLVQVVDRSAIRRMIAGLVVTVFCGVINVPCVAALVGDANCDGVTNVTDLAAQAAVIFSDGGCADAAANSDVNADGRVTAADVVGLVMLLTAPVPTPTSTATMTGTPTSTFTFTATESPTETPTETPTLSPTSVPTETPTLSPTSIPTATPTLSPTVTPTTTPTISAAPTTTPTWTLSPTPVTPSAAPTMSQTPTRTFTVTVTPTRTLTPLPTSPYPGPQVLFFGIANNDGCVACDAPLCDCSGEPTPTPAYDSLGRRIFQRVDPRFIIVVEARPGSSSAPVCVGQAGCAGLEPADPATRPDLQIESTSPLGDGDPTVDWRTGLPEAEWGGIAAVAPPSFGSDQSVTDALQDFASRFGIYNYSFACTLDAYGNPATVTVTQDPALEAALAQFCDPLVQNANATFPSGDTILTVQVRDTAQNIGPTAQIVVRMVTPTP